MICLLIIKVFILSLHQAHTLKAGLGVLFVLKKRRADGPSPFILNVMIYASFAICVAYEATASASDKFLADLAAMGP